MIDIEEDSPEAILVGKYLDLVDRYGQHSAQVRLFLDVHADSQALREWSAIVVEVEQPLSLFRFIVVSVVMVALTWGALALLWWALERMHTR